jgi:predicted alpha/beta-fold hydrolase
LPLLSNPHVQTLLGHFLPGPLVVHPTHEQVIRLPDGDAVVLHDSVPDGWQEGSPITVLVHGLTGSHASPYVQRLAHWLLQAGRRVVRIDLRGAGKSLPLSRSTYHGGCSHDLRAGLEEIHRAHPSSPLILVGVSLGGNIVLKLGGEAVDRPVAGLARIIALAPPVDLGRCAEVLAERRNRLYEMHFVGELLAHARQRQKHFPDLPPLHFPRRVTLRVFDDLYTAPRCGFADAQDYYRRASSLSLVPHIQVPTFILTARDDPFVVAEPIETLKVPPHIQVRVVPHGGHLGFLGWDGAGGIRWAERRVVELVAGA